MTDWNTVFQTIDEKIWSKCGACAAGRFYSFLGGIALHLLLFFLLLMAIVGHWVLLMIILSAGFYWLGYKSGRTAQAVKNEIEAVEKAKFDAEQAHIAEMTKQRHTEPYP